MTAQTSYPPMTTHLPALVFWFPTLSQHPLQPLREPGPRVVTAILAGPVEAKMSFISGLQICALMGQERINVQGEQNRATVFAHFCHCYYCLWSVNHSPLVVGFLFRSHPYLLVVCCCFHLDALYPSCSPNLKLNSFFSLKDGLLHFC